MDCIFVCKPKNTLIMGLKDSLKNLFSTSKKVGTERVEQRIEEAKVYVKEKTETLEEVVEDARESVKEFVRETSIKTEEIVEKIQEKADVAKDKIETKAEEVWQEFEAKAVTVVDNLEAKIRGVELEAEPKAEIDLTVENPSEPTADSASESEKPGEAAKA
jgi:hypothetical protein